MKLLPCPFCGSDEQKIIGYSSFAIQCPICESRTGWKPSETIAAIAWNRRPEASQTPPEARNHSIEYISRTDVLNTIKRLDENASPYMDPSSAFSEVEDEIMKLPVLGTISEPQKAGPVTPPPLPTLEQQHAAWVQSKLASRFAPDTLTRLARLTPDKSTADNILHAAMHCGIDPVRLWKSLKSLNSSDS